MSFVVSLQEVSGEFDIFNAANQKPTLPSAALLSVCNILLSLRLCRIAGVGPYRRDIRRRPSRAPSPSKNKVSDSG